MHEYIVPSSSEYTRPRRNVTIVMVFDTDTNNMQSSSWTEFYHREGTKKCPPVMITFYNNKYILRIFSYILD